MIRPNNRLSQTLPILKAYPSALWFYIYICVCVFIYLYIELCEGYWMNSTIVDKICIHCSIVSGCMVSCCRSLVLAFIFTCIAILCMYLACSQYSKQYKECKMFVNTVHHYHAELSGQLDVIVDRCKVIFDQLKKRYLK